MTNDGVDINTLLIINSRYITDYQHDILLNTNQLPPILVKLLCNMMSSVQAHSVIFDCLYFGDYLIPLDGDANLCMSGSQPALYVIETE